MVINALVASPSVRRVMFALMKDDIRRSKEMRETIAALALLADRRFQRLIKKITREQIQKALENDKQPVNQARPRA
jgi:hypothetical protein